MSKPMKQTFKLTAIAAALLAVSGSVLAAEGLVLDRNSISIGIGNWSNDRLQTGMYDGMRDSGLYGLLDADLLKRDDATGTWLGLKARSLGLDNREIKLDWLRQGDIGFSLEYSRISRDQPFIYNTGLQGIGTTRLTVVNIVPGAGTNWELGTVRDRYTAKFFKSLGTGLIFNAAYREENKEGTRGWGRGGSPEFAVEPIDSTIRIFEATLNYSRDRLQLSGGYYGTSYDTRIPLVTTLGTVVNNGSTTFYASQPLDNISHEVFLNGGYNFTPTTRGTLKASYSKATQDEYLPTAGIPGLADTRAPNRLGGKLETTLLEAGLTAKPMPELSIVANLRYRDFADKTPLQQYVYAGTQTWNTPFSYTNTTGKLEGTYRLPQSYSLLGGIEYRSQDRSIPNVGTTWTPFRASMDEATYTVQLRKAMSETLNGYVSYAHSDRDGSAYTPPSNPAGEPLQQRINPMNLADRKRDKVRVMLDWAPAERLGLQFVVEDARDDYGGPNFYGLQGGTARLYSVDASYQMNTDWAIIAWASRDKNQASEITQQTVAITKYNDLDETGNSFGVGLNGKFSSTLKAGANVEQFRSVNRYSQQVVGSALPAATMVPTPDITNTLLRFNIFANYAVQKNADLRFNVIYEKWSTDDWSWMMFPAGGRTPFAYCGANCAAATATDGTTVSANPKQDSTFVGVRYIYRFQ